MHTGFVKTGLFAFATAALLCSCHSREVPQDTSSTGTTASQSALPTDLSTLGSPQEVVMKSGELRMTMGDYEDCVALHRFHGRIFSKRAMANPRFQRDEAKRCFQTIMLKDYAQKHALMPTQEDRQRALDEAMKRAEAGNREHLLKRLELSPEQLDRLIDLSLLPALMQRHLVMSMNDAEARAAFDLDGRRYSIELADFENAPTDDEVEEFLHEHEKDLSTYFTQHQELLSGPPHAAFIRMGFPKSGGPEDAGSIKAAEALRLTAIQHGATGAISACQTQKDAGCAVYNDASNPYVEARNEHNLWAFRSPEGTVSTVIQTPTNADIWILQSVEPPQPYDTTTPAIRQKLASQAMIALQPAPHLIDKLKPALTVTNPDLKQTTEALGGNFRFFDAVPYLNLVEQKQIESPAVMKTLSEMTPSEMRLYSNPVLDNGRVYVFFVSLMQPPTDADYAQYGEAWRARKAADPTHPLTTQWLSSNLPNMSTLNLAPIQAEYGVLQPNGTIR